MGSVHCGMRGVKQFGDGLNLRLQLGPDTIPGAEPMRESVCGTWIAPGGGCLTLPSFGSVSGKHLHSTGGCFRGRDKETHA
jgi:hypothetical protein